MLDELLKNLIDQVVEEKLVELEKKLLTELSINQAPFLSRQEAADYLNCCLASLDNYVRKGQIEKFKTGRKTLFRKADLEKLPI